MPEVTISKRKVALFAFLIIVVAAAWYSGLNEYLSFESLKGHREALLALVESHYALSLAIYALAAISTAFFVPGSIPVTIVGGLMFGVARGAFFMLLSATLGDTLAFLLSRNLIGRWVQHRYESQLRLFNSEVERHGHNYMITLRVMPLLPCFLLNYFAGITRMPVSSFVWTTALGMLPGSVVYAFAGNELGRIESPGEIMTPRLVAALALLALFAMLPAVHRHGKWLREKLLG
ncbi:MAG: TVP38/TMEM64 family protein [Nitrospirota bacterium]